MVDGVISAAEDLRKAVLHLRESAATFNIDPNRIVLGGFSAGAVTSWNVAHGMGVPVSGVFLLSGTDAGFDVNKAVTASSDTPPILLLLSQYDLAGVLSSVPLLVAHYEEVGVENEFAWVPGFGHFYPAGAASLGGDAVSMSVEGRIAEFLERVIGNGQGRIACQWRPSVFRISCSSLFHIGFDEPEILRCSNTFVCPTGAHVRQCQSEARSVRLSMKDETQLRRHLGIYQI